MSFVVECPHCKCQIFIEQINCAIFRHAVYISNNQPIPPHSSKEVCEQLVFENKVVGCAKPFKLVQQNGQWTAIVCEYI